MIYFKKKPFKQRRGKNNFFKKVKVANYLTLLNFPRFSFHFVVFFINSFQLQTFRLVQSFDLTQKLRKEKIHKIFILKKIYVKNLLTDSCMLGNLHVHIFLKNSQVERTIIKKFIVQFHIVLMRINFFFIQKKINCLKNLFLIAKQSTKNNSKIFIQIQHFFDTSNPPMVLQCIPKQQNETGKGMAGYS
eukprot:TRINITY_DN238_c1_g1_i3.p2 TRINITY_DN238_c1_g1~~TRINITY_DN238_c1_g1_i3.p2  ORF type:complete len:197 (+),score=-4.08 TRINITY_DN238_c1_g1_i3:27-593(+)